MTTFKMFFLLCFLQCCKCQKLEKNHTRQDALNNVNVYLRVGDSNETGGGAQGSEDGSFPVKYHTVLRNTIIYYKPNLTSANNGAWLNYSDSNGYINRFSGEATLGLTDIYTPPLPVGADISFAFSLDSALKKKVAIIKCALGGTALTNEWAKPGTMYNFFMDYSCLVGLPVLNKPYTVKALIVRLGTNDVVSGVYNNTTFKAGLQSFCSNVRSDLSLPTLPIYWVQVNENLNDASHPEANVIAARAAIAACADENDAAYIPGFHVLNYDADPLMPDNVHYSPQATIPQGIREALTMISLE